MTLIIEAATGTTGEIVDGHMVVRCRNCNRLDCPLLASSIIGERNYINALADCMTAGSAQRPKPVRR